MKVRDLRLFLSTHTRSSGRTFLFLKKIVEVATVMKISSNSDQDYKDACTRRGILSIRQHSARRVKKFDARAIENVLAKMYIVMILAI